MPIIESLKKSFIDLVNKGELNYPQLLTLERMQKMASTHVQVEIAKMRDLAMRMYEIQKDSKKQNRNKNAMVFAGVKKTAKNKARKRKKIQNATESEEKYTKKPRP